MLKITTANTILYCEKWRETVDFYANVLALPQLFANEWFVEFELTAGARLSVADETRATIESSAGRGVTISLQVDDACTTRAALTDALQHPTPIKDLWGANVTYVHDPEGNRLEFWSQRTRP